MRRKTGLRLGRHNLALPLFSSVVAGHILPAPRPSCDWLSKVPSWDPLGNDTVGDCVFAATLNGVRVFAANTSRPVPDFGAADAFGLYHAVVPAFDPDKPDTDVGSDFDAAGAYWQVIGVAGTKIISRIRINPGNLQLLKLAIDWLGPVFVGVALPDNAEDQFDANEPWSIVAGKPPNQDNGHEVLVGAYDGDVFEAVTWGQRQKLKAAWLMECASPRLGGDLQAVVTDQWIRTNQLSPSMLHLSTIKRDADLLLTG